MADEFDLLAAKVLSGEATPGELARFEELLSADRDRRAEFEELRKLWLRVRELAPLTDAWDAPPAPPPAHMQRAWEERVEEQLSHHHRKRVLFMRSALALAAVLVLSTASFFFFSPSRSATPLQLALSQPRETLGGLLVTTRDVRAFPIYSPAGFTAHTTPLIAWKALPGKTYDLSIADELAPAEEPLRSTGLISPVYFEKAWPGRTLARDGLYRLRISAMDQPDLVSELIFRVLPQQSNGDASAQDPIERAHAMLAANPARFGDALAVLLTLPPELANSERALRLKAFAFGQLGYAEEFEATLARIPSRR